MKICSKAFEYVPFNQLTQSLKSKKIVSEQCLSLFNSNFFSFKEFGPTQAMAYNNDTFKLLDYNRTLYIFATKSIYT